MAKKDRKNSSAHEQKLDILSDIGVFLLGILMIIWAGFQITYSIKNNIHNVFLYIVYISLIIFCLASLITLGKKLLRDLSKWRHR